MRSYDNSNACKTILRYLYCGYQQSNDLNMVNLKCTCIQELMKLCHGKLTSLAWWDLLLGLSQGRIYWEKEDWLDLVLATIIIHIRQ